MKQIAIENIAAGSIIQAYGYRYMVLDNRFDPIGNGTERKPRPRRVLIADAVPGTKLPQVYTYGMTLGGIIGEQMFTVESTDHDIDAFLSEK